MTRGFTQFHRVWRMGLGVVALASLFSYGISRSWALEFPPCPPPATNEYLLLVRGDSEAERTRIQNLLPSNSTVLVCSYLEDTVVRAGGFSNLENANAWAQYMTEVEGLQAFVARPAIAGVTNPPTPEAPNSSSPPAAPAAPAAPTPAPATSPSRYSPRGLGEGYAVLVDYQNNPEIAYEIQASVGQAVGLAVYRQQAYVLIAHSPNIEGAASTLTVLSSKLIPGFIVDSQGVVMLTPAIAAKAHTPGGN